MTTTSAAPSAPISSFIPQPSSLPPSPRDFLAYERIIIDGFSTRQAAEELKISQTRVRQLVRKVADWLAENLPAHDETRQAAQIRLAQHIAADRLHRYLNEVEHAWQRTRETKYLSPIIRLLTALSKIPAHPHTLLALAPDSTESLWEGEAPAEPQRAAGVQPAVTEQSRVGQACEASAGPPTPTRSVSEGKTASAPLWPVSDRATASTDGLPAASEPTLPSSPAPPPPNRACSPPQTPSPITSPNHSPKKQLSPSPETPSTSNHNATNPTRQSFLSPAHPPGGTGILPVSDSASNEPLTITQLQITPQSVGVTSPKHSSRHDRRRLQRLLAKK